MLNQFSFFFKHCLTISAICLLCIGCSGTNRSNITPMQQGEDPISTIPESYSNDSDTTITLSDALTELTELETPEGVDPEMFRGLKDTFRQVLISQNKEVFSACAPHGKASMVKDLWIVEDEGSTGLEWTYRNQGDYDQNGETNIADIAPLGQYFHARLSDGLETWYINRVADGDGNFENNIADLSPIGENFFGKVNAYLIETAPPDADLDVDESWLAVRTVDCNLSSPDLQDGCVRWQTLPGDGYKRLSFDQIALVEGNFYRVVPILRIGSEDQRGQVSQHVQFADCHKGVPKEETVILDDLEITVGFMSENQITLTSDRQPSITPGQIIVSKERGGILRKVKSIVYSGNDTILDTEPATLEMAVDRINLRADAILSPESKVEFLPSAGFEHITMEPVIDHETSDFVIDVDTGITQRLNISIPSQYLPNGVSIEGFAQFSEQVGLDVRMGNSWRDFGELKHFYFGETRTIDAKLTIAAEHEIAQFEKIWTLGMINLGTYIFYMGPVPIVVTVTMPVQVIINGNLEVRLEIGPYCHSVVKSGIEWTPENDWQPVKDQSITGGLTQPTFMGNANLYAGIDWNLKVSINGLGGPYLKLTAPYMDFTAQYTTPPPSVHAELDGGISAAIGAHVTILNIPLIEYDIASFIDVNFTVWEANWTEDNKPPNEPTNPNPGNNATNITVDTALSWTGGDPDGDTVTYDVYLDTANPPTASYPGQTGTSFNPTGNLNQNTTYYWKIVANDGQSTTAGPIWRFTTANGSTNHPPNVPTNPNPGNNASNVPITADLSWTGGDPDAGDTVTYDVYFGTSNSPPQVSSNQPNPSYDPGTLNSATQYYWKVVARDSYGATTEGLLWMFTTTNVNSPPYVPNNPSPANYAIDISVNTGLTWTGGDPDAGDTVTYDVYFSTLNPPQLISNDQPDTSYTPSGSLNYNTTYYWKIVAEDNHGAVSTGPVWLFTTGDSPNNPPYAAGNPNPANNATNVSTEADLGWTGGDPDAGDTVKYDVFFGLSSDPPLLSSNQPAATYNPGHLNTDTRYYWKITSRDNHGETTEGLVWMFTTAPPGNNPPNTPSNPTPVNGASNVSVDTNLSWTGGDPDGDNVTYNVFFGETNPPPSASTNQTGITFDPPGSLNHSTVYYWRIDAKDEQDATTTGSVWQFTTAPPGNDPPYTPSNPTPTNNATNVSVNTNLSWTGGDPNGDSVTYNVFFGETNPPPQVSTDQSGTTFNPPVSLNNNTIYYWKIEAKDEYDATTTGPVWQFTTEGSGNAPTVVITNPSANATVSLDSQPAAICTDSDGTITKVEFYVDNILSNTQTSTYPSGNTEGWYMWGAPTSAWDISAETNTTHTLKVKAYDNDNLTGEQTITVTVVNNGGVTTGSYAARLDSQSHGVLSLTPGQSTTITVTYTNIGTACWFNYGPNPVRLATTSHNGQHVNPSDVSSQFWDCSWLKNNRIDVIKGDIGPQECSGGNSVTFTIPIHVPSNLSSGTYYLNWNLVLENSLWIQDNNGNGYGNYFVQINVS